MIVKKPTFEAFATKQSGDRTRWIKIGAAWPHKESGGMNIQFDALPVDGRVVLLPVKDKQTELE